MFINASCVIGLGLEVEAFREARCQAGQMTCYHCRQLGHMRRDCPRRQRSHGTEAEHADQPDMQSTFYTCICFLMHHVH